MYDVNADDEINAAFAQETMLFVIENRGEWGHFVTSGFATLEFGERKTWAEKAWRLLMACETAEKQWEEVARIRKACEGQDLFPTR